MDFPGVTLHEGDGKSWRILRVCGAILENRAWLACPAGSDHRHHEVQVMAGRVNRAVELNPGPLSVVGVAELGAKSFSEHMDFDTEVRAYGGKTDVHQVLSLPSGVTCTDTNLKALSSTGRMVGVGGGGRWCRSWRNAGRCRLRHRSGSVGWASASVDDCIVGTEVWSPTIATLVVAAGTATSSHWSRFAGELLKPDKFFGPQRYMRHRPG